MVVMAGRSKKKPAARGAKSSGGNLSRIRPERTNVVRREATEGRVVASKARFAAVMLAAERSGLLSQKSGRIGGRVSPVLVKQAKRQTGIETDTDLIEFALATIALEDNFADVFKESRGNVDPELKLGF